MITFPDGWVPVLGEGAFKRMTHGKGGSRAPSGGFPVSLNPITVFSVRVGRPRVKGQVGLGLWR